jgi:O-antigen/teichoic acid export membrane protein
MNKLVEKHGVKILYAASLAGLGFSFLGSLLNSKLLTKESFGDWKYLQNYVVFISYFVNFGLYSSGGRLIAATNDKIKIRIYKGYMLYFASGGMLVIILSTIVSGLLFPKLLNSNLFHLAIVLMPFFIVNPLIFYFESTYQGERKLGSLAVYRFAPPFAYVTLLYALKSHSEGSIYYNAMLYYASYFTVFMILIWSDKPIFKKNTSEWTDLRLQHKSYGVHLYWGSLWGVGAIYLLPILIGFFNINNVEVGHYGLALSFIMPLVMLPGIVGTSYFKQYIYLKNIPTDAFKKVVFSSLALLIMLMLGIDFFINLLLGDKYKEVATLIKIGAPGAILHGLGDFVNKFLMAKGESKYLKKVSVAVGLVQLASSLILIKLFSATGGIVAKSLGSVVFFFALYIYYYKKYIIQKSEGIKVVIQEEEFSNPVNMPAE